MDAKDLKIEMKSQWKEEWEPSTPEKFLETICFTRDIIMQTGDRRHDPDVYSDERATNALASGETVSTPTLLFRLAEGVECPRCHAKFVKSIGALSRADNKTLICPACGTQEAMSDYRAAKKRAHKA